MGVLITDTFTLFAHLRECRFGQRIWGSISLILASTSAYVSGNIALRPCIPEKQLALTSALLTLGLLERWVLNFIDFQRLVSLYLTVTVLSRYLSCIFQVYLIDIVLQWPCTVVQSVDMQPLCWSVLVESTLVHVSHDLWLENIVDLVSRESQCFGRHLFLIRFLGLLIERSPNGDGLDIPHQSRGKLGDRYTFLIMNYATRIVWWTIFGLFSSQFAQSQKLGMSLLLFHWLLRVC